MTKITILSAAAVLSMLAAAPASAQFAQQEPAAFAATYPNASIRHVGVRSSIGAMAFLPPGKSHVKRHLARR
ncbi:hypothetical protein ACFFWD_30535 [Bradyrhizobium erythrophlei]|uniref:hypothetical protein n=1 Tax=Bradyrhizobium erythrophlei TaxID=1437360 RepID=UPI0035E861C8